MRSLFDFVVKPKGSRTSNKKDIKVERVAKRPDKQAPGKIPDELKNRMKNENSRDAADDALKKFFTGR